MTIDEIDKLTYEQWADKYAQLVYAIEFDSKRLSGNKSLKFPM